ncbi:unnamed protein product [Symbiodinium natans]|uniref:Uncharacterized protein n=1 Tax=Symbiodinium natans TaxID=878477 RepID=A0A812K517_9DINO|nr:unnamed protein product [Symbiodinium natans]
MAKDLKSTILGSVAAVVGVYLLAVVLPQHVEETPSHRRYLDSGGLGAAIWGSLLIFYFAPNIAMSEDIEDTECAKHWEGQLHGTSANEVVSVLGKHEDTFSCCAMLNPFGRFGSFLFLVLRTVGNAAFIVYNFCTLPTRDPDERLNQAKHCVTWLEFPGTVLVLSIITLLAIATLCTSNMKLALAWRDALKAASTFSVLQTLPLASPMTFKKTIEEAIRTKGLVLGIAKSVQFLWLVPLAILSVLVKIGQVDFITETIVWDWGFWEFFALAGFINNLAGLRGDHDAAKVEGMFLLVDKRDPQTLRGLWESEVAASAQQLYGTLGALVVLSTLSEQHVCQLLNPRNNMKTTGHGPGLYGLLKVEP